MNIKHSIIMAGSLTIFLIPFFYDVVNQQHKIYVVFIIFAIYMISEMLLKYVYTLCIKFMEIDSIAQINKKAPKQITALFLLSVVLLGLTFIFYDLIPILCLYTMSANMVCNVDTIICKNDDLYLNTNCKISNKIIKIEITESDYKLFLDNGIVKVYVKTNIDEQVINIFNRYNG